MLESVMSLFRGALSWRPALPTQGKIGLALVGAVVVGAVAVAAFKPAHKPHERLAARVEKLNVVLNKLEAIEAKMQTADCKPAAPKPSKKK